MIHQEDDVDKRIYLNYIYEYTSLAEKGRSHGKIEQRARQKKVDPMAK